MEKGLLEMIINKLDKPQPNLLFLAGYLKIKTELDDELIFDILKSVYYSTRSTEDINQIEEHLLNLNLAKVCQFGNEICFICKEIEGDIIYINCVHCYHKKCISDYLIEQVKKGEEKVCPICKSDFSRFLFHDKDLARENLKSLKVELNLQKTSLLAMCYSCQQIYTREVEEQHACPYCHAPNN